MSHTIIVWCWNEEVLSECLHDGRISTKKLFLWEAGFLFVEVCCHFFTFYPFQDETSWQEFKYSFLYMALASNALVYFLLNRLLLRRILFLPWYTYCKMQNLTLRRRQHGLSQMLPLEDLMTRLGLFFVCILYESPLIVLFIWFDLWSGHTLIVTREPIWFLMRLQVNNYSWSLSRTSSRFSSYLINDDQALSIDILLECCYVIK